jgi:spermidine synthase
MAISGRKICFHRSEYVVYEPYRGLHIAYHAKKFCYSGHSKYQRIDIIDNDAYGRMLLLDGNVQHTAYDSHIFNEGLCGTAKRNGVARVVVLGGGSGQTVLSLLESSSVEKVTVIEIDPLVVDCCRKYIRGVNHAFRDSRVNIVIGDAFRHLHAMDEEFDAAIIDLTEKPIWSNGNSSNLRRIYSDIKEKCGGRCSQYVGSSVGLADSRRERRRVENVGSQSFSNLRFEDVFIPSFGAPHTFMHAGYEE